MTRARDEGWNTALDAQTSLLRSFGTVEGRRYQYSFAQSLGRAGVYDAETGEILDGDAERASALVHGATVGLSQCDPMYVNADLSELVDYAAEGFKPEPLIATDLLVPSGFAYFAKPLFVTDTRGLQMPFRAIQWNISEDKTGVLVAFYAHRADGDPLDEGEGYANVRIGGSDLALEYVTFMRFGQDSSVFTIDESIRDVLVHVKVFFRLCQQTIALPSRERVARPTWKRARATWKEIREVVVFTLRRGRGSTEYEGEEREVEWSHRWIVQGHWRRQPYVERDEEGNKRTIYRQIYIAPFVKGPDDKPLIFKRRAFELIR